MVYRREMASIFRAQVLPDGSLKLFKKGARNYIAVPVDEIENLIGILEDAGDSKPTPPPKIPLHQQKPEQGPDVSWRLQCYFREGRRRISRGVYYFGTEQAVEVFRRTIGTDITESVLARRGSWKATYVTMDVRLHKSSST